MMEAIVVLIMTGAQRWFIMHTQNKSVVKLTTEERQVSIADTIAAGDRPSVAELALKYNVSERTIRRDLRHPYVLRKVKEQILDETKPQDIVDVLSCIRGAINGGDVVTARWYYEMLFGDIDDQKEDVEKKITKKILGNDPEEDGTGE